MEDNEQSERPIKITRAEPKPYKLGRPYSYDPIPESQRAVAMDQADIQEEYKVNFFKQFGMVNMDTKRKIATAITGLVIAVLGHFVIELPPMVVGFIDTAVALLIGWLIPSPTAKGQA